ncbi:NADPH dehydrogenase [Halalkalicoccus paucihalophilus]|uniref:NADPH dehydrogenase n=1 Tax=Halalkalicoccus paucihalophilus TaxID=1008153 RepID=A0A151AHA4_9EURY|nr:NADH-dependent flavin oxidoreductase [Halalkalicoccus paucihalophilus]KYH27028.1 NADPH dehydrogenase [Halalkalicoccus paucihalophilus]
MSPRLTDPLTIGGLSIPNRLYRAPLLECAGNGPGAVDTLISELEPAAESGVGLIFQGATIVRGEGGCAAPGMTRVHDPEFVSRLGELTDAIHDHGSRVFLQLEHGGLRSMETWHAGYRAEHPDIKQLAVSRPPRSLRLADRLGILEYDPQVLSTEEVYDLAADFGRSAKYALSAGYDGIHIAGANMGIVQQFLSPFYNRRTDEFGGSLTNRVRFLAAIHDEVRERAGSVPLVTKVPAETGSPAVVRRYLSERDAIEICRACEAMGYNAVAPVRGSVFWDMSLIRGEFPERAWADERFAEGYEDAFGAGWRAVALANRIHATGFDFEPAWNAGLCEEVRKRVSIPVLCEGGIRGPQIGRVLGTGADAVGMGRPFYAEPRLPARVLSGERAVCENCNNCTVPQVAGARGVCRTPSVLAKRGELVRRGAYER